MMWEASRRVKGKLSGDKFAPNETRKFETALSVILLSGSSLTHTLSSGERTDASTYHIRKIPDLEAKS
jgi:hypothetical protein